MGQEFTDPFKNCCCVAPNDINRGKDGGTNTVLEFDDVLHSNMAWIQKIQANWKGKVQRMRYLKQRAEHRAKGSQFNIGDTMETVSRRRVIELRLLFNSNEAELNEQLEMKTVRYRTSGAAYDGLMLGGFRHGRGSMQFKDGSTYEGTWYLGYAHGYGKYTQVAGETYEGEWSNNMYHGKGTSTHVNFFVYHGMFRKGTMVGEGKETYPDGTQFFGNYENNKRNGYGVQKWPDGQTYAGMYKDGLIEGFGTYRWPDGKEYTGDWVNQKMYGFGVQEYPNGRRYEGFYKLDKRQGYGIYMMPDQQTYSGAWFEGKQHGYGCTYNSKNELKYGLWNQGKKIYKLSPEQATDIQDSRMDLADTPGVMANLGENKLVFFGQVSVLTNRFEPFDNFATEQAKFELNKCAQNERSDKLVAKMNQLEIDMD